MDSILNSNTELDAQKEDEIFKSLSHNIRRKIIKILGKNEAMSFTQIKNELITIDSPTLSYHLKSLSEFIEQSESLYRLTEIGNAALILLSKIDHSTQLKNNKKKFLYANIATVCCWTAMMIIVGNLFGSELKIESFILMTIIFQVFAQLNYQIVFNLWSRTWHVKDNKKKHHRLIN